MKYFKAGFAAAVLLALGAITFHVALAQQGPGSDSSETVARPRKKNPQPDTATEPASIQPDSPATSTPPEDEPAVEQPKIPSKFTKPKDKEVPENTPTFSSDVNTVELDRPT